MEGEIEVETPHNPHALLSAALECVATPECGPEVLSTATIVQVSGTSHTGTDPSILQPRITRKEPE